MAKISPVSIKYMITANFSAEGALEKPDVIGALFGQTEGLLGADLEMRELQKEGKIGRIEVDLERKDKSTIGVIKIPTALDQSETTLIAAAIETIERIGPSDAHIEVQKIDDVRGNKRDFIIERAKKLMKELSGSTDSRDISNQIKDHSKTSDLIEYGSEKLPAGDLSGNEIIVVEGRADVLNLMRAGVKNVIGMNGTKLPEAIKELSRDKEITLFVDGDRGGKLIARNVVDNAKVKYIAVAPDGKEVEELNGKEILMKLRKKVSTDDFFSGFSGKTDYKENYTRHEKREVEEENKEFELSSEEKKKLKEMFEDIKGTGKALILNRNLKVLKEVSSKTLSGVLRRFRNVPAIVVDDTVTKATIFSAEDVGCKVIIGKNFSTTDTKIKLMSL